MNGKNNSRNKSNVNVGGWPVKYE